MFMVPMQDEAVYRKLMEKVEREGSTVDDVVREWLGQEDDDFPADEETSAMKLLRLIDEAYLQFDSPFDACDAEDILRNEA